MLRLPKLCQGKRDLCCPLCLLSALFAASLPWISQWSLRRQLENDVNSYLNCLPNCQNILKLGTKNSFLDTTCDWCDYCELRATSKPLFWGAYSLQKTEKRKLHSPHTLMHEAGLVLTAADTCLDLLSTRWAPWSKSKHSSTRTTLLFLGCCFSTIHTEPETLMKTKICFRCTYIFSDLSLFDGPMCSTARWMCVSSTTVCFLAQHKSFHYTLLY